MRNFEESEEENAGQHHYGDFEPNDDSITPYWEPFSFPNQGNLQSQQHGMRLRNRRSSDASQSVPYPLLPNQSVQYELTQEQLLQAGSSSGGNRLPQYQRNQLRSHTKHLKENVCDSTLDRAQKKRIADKKSREKRKKEKLETQSELDVLQEENKLLKSQNESFTKENTEMNQTLQNHKETIKRLKNDFGKLKRKKEKQSVHVKALLDKVADSEYANIQPEYLKNIIGTSSQNADNEILQLTLENEKLKFKNKRRKVKVQALCKVISESNKSSEQDHTE